MSADSYTVEKSCPNCHRYLGKYEDFSIPTAEQLQVKYGSPFQKCPSCGYEFIDPLRLEIAVHEADKRDSGYLPLGKFWTIFIIAAIAAIAGISTAIGDGEKKGLYVAIACAVFVLIMLAWALGTYKARAAEVQKQTEASFQRFSDPEYIARLKAIGYLPEEFVYNNGPSSREEVLQLRRHLREWAGKEHKST